MKRLALSACLSLITTAAQGAVFLNEVYMNPVGSLDNTKEYFELVGPPNMKLDGYAIAVVNGAQRKVHPASPFPPNCSDDPAIVVCQQEIDEFFSLDGLSLGANGILVLARGPLSSYPTVLADTVFREWDNPNIWNGLLDTPGGMENDGSNTIMLIRNRPGVTQANPSNPAGLRWGKDIAHDVEKIVIDETHIQYGDGNFDTATDDGNGGTTLDLKGKSTLDDVSDDLEVVDEVSYEDAAGWEYDQDDRKVDVGSASLGLPERNVHALDDPQGFNPDVIVRVDYRTKGPGWTPVGGATGEGPGGNNWQDTATEQWIRGETVQCSSGCTGQGAVPQFFFDNTPNTNPDSVQPFNVNVPLWLNDGTGLDYNFAGTNTYQIMAGRVNPLSIVFNPGDTDRDGDCDVDDIAKLAAVFGNDNWVFSNSFEESPEGDDGDPATQTRPWDVDLTGNNGIEASDLQWVLNFQGNTSGRVVGVRYDSTTPTPAGQGVYLNPNTGVTCVVTASAASLSGRALDSLKVGDIVELTVSARVSDGFNNNADQQNGIMQFVQDLLISNAGVFKALDAAGEGAFNITRASKITGINGGQGGLAGINGYTTSFTQGLGGSTPLAKIRLQAIGLGATSVAIAPAAESKFAISTPRGLKVGHTNNNGNPASATYPAAIALGVTSTVRPDFNLDGHVDAVTGSDLAHLIACRSGPTISQALPACQDAKLDADSDVDQDDFAIYQRCYSGPTGTPAMNCDVP